MSRAAGTLITTNNATYFPPRFMPGYRGYCPTMKYDYGETYGNATSKYFQDYRSSVLNSSASNYSNGGQFPTYYTHNPDMVISNRSRNQDRWLLSPKYQLSNVDHDRSEQIRSVDYLSHKHREHYKDKTGTLKSVDFFKLPVSAEDQFRTKDVLPRKPLPPYMQGKMEIDGDGDIRKNKRGLAVERKYDRLIKYHHVH
ncbi:ciliary microtubule inner protein 2C-like isoform X3 [Littorina saxatilis]|uniref:Ciliary microtubule inner protein 2C n=1 Tax=Littorina saxatilis TaxID=31220 RepID=A0AAN9B9B1_9CAEN